MILKAEILLDANEMIRPEDIRALIEFLFKENDHLAKLIICEVKEAEKKHRWEFYMNGTFCKDCGAQIGCGYPCR